MRRISIATITGLLLVGAVCAPGAAAKTKKTFKLRLPSADNVTVARGYGKLKGSKKAPKLKVKPLPSGVSAVGKVIKKKRGRFEVEVAIFRPSGKPPSTARGEEANAPTVTGETGLFTLLSGDTLPRGSFRFDLFSSGDALGFDGTPEKACDPNPPPGFVLLGGATIGNPDTAIAAAENACRHVPPFFITLSNPSWQHHVPQMGQTTVCVDVATSLPQGSAAVVGYLFDPSDYIPDGFASQSALRADGTQHLTFVIGTPDTYKIDVGVRTLFGLNARASGQVTVPGPPTNGPTPCV
jgi:hypothetical protein